MQSVLLFKSKILICILKTDRSFDFYPFLQSNERENEKYGNLKSTFPKLKTLNVKTKC